MKFKKIAAAALAAATITGSINTSVFAFKNNDYTILYVSPTGNDSADGTMENPLATLDGARNKIRQIKNSGGLATDGAVVYFREGNYNIDESIVFTEEDSGTEKQPIMYRAYRDEKATFLGGIQISGSAFKKTTDNAVLSRIIEATARDKIYEIKLADVGITEKLERAWNGAYSKSGIEDVIVAPNCDGDYELFIDGTAMIPARFPNEGFTYTSEVLETFVYNKMTQEEKDSYKSIPELERPTVKLKIVENDRAKMWSNAKDALIFGYFGHDWADATLAIRDIDPDTGVIRSKYPHRYAARADARVFVNNLIEEIDVPGEFYVDNEKGMLYIYPPKDLANSDIKISVLTKPMIQLDGTKHITFKNLDFTVVRTNFVNGTDTENIELNGCNFTFSADMAVLFRGGRENGAINCYFGEVNGGFRHWNSGDRATLTSGDSYVENCEFENFARLSKTYRYAIQFNACVGDRTMYNEIHGAGHAGFTSNGNNSIVAFNEAYDLCTETNDAGAFYVGRQTTTRGNKFLYNYMHDIGTNIEGDHGVIAVYLDDGFGSYDIAGNVFENIAGKGVLIGSGRDNTVYNNIFVNCTTSIHGKRYGDLNSVLTDIDNHTLYKTDIWKEAYPELYAMVPEDKNTPAGNVFSTNLVYKSGAPDIHATIESLGLVENNYVTNSDPGFVDEANRNYVLKSDSDIYDKIPGFTAVPFTRMGRYSDRAIDRISDGVALCINSPYAYVNGTRTTVDTNEAVMPVIYEDYTYLPIRFVAESLGGEVGYDDATGIARIELDDKTVEIDINNSTAVLSGESVELAAPVRLEQGRTLVPVRSVSELLGKQVFWDDLGLVVVSDYENLLGSEKDKELVRYIHNQLTLY